MNLLHPTDPGYKAHIARQFERVLSRPHDFIDIVITSADFATAKDRIEREFEVEPEIAVQILHTPVMRLTVEELTRLGARQPAADED